MSSRINRVISTSCWFWSSIIEKNEGARRCSCSTSDVQRTHLGRCACLQLSRTSYSPHTTPTDNWSGTDISLQSDTLASGLLQRTAVRRPIQQHPKAAASPEQCCSDCDAGIPEIGYTGYLFTNVFSTSWQPYPSRSVRRQHQRTSAVISILGTVRGLSAPLTLCYLAVCLLKLTLRNVLFVAPRFLSGTLYLPL